MTALATLEVRSPFGGELVGSVPASGAEEVREALEAGAASRWSASRHERSELLFAIADRLRGLTYELATLISRESGLWLNDTRQEVGRAVDVFRFAAIESLHDDGEAFAGDVTPHGRDRRAYTLRVPVSLVAAITPFNHSLNQVAHKLAPAIAAGAPIVVKPSERTPLTALRLVELLHEAGAPGPAVQAVCGDPATILDEFLAHDSVEVVSFTGGVAVGKTIARRLGYRRAVLELGGNDPLLVLADADLDEAAELAVRGAFQNSGQRCTAVKRIIAVDAIADDLAERIVERTRTLRCVRRTAIRVLWLVDRDAQAGVDYDLDRLLPFWKLTSEQDWELYERNQVGVENPAYTPGPYSPEREHNVIAFDAWYLGRMALS